MLVISNIYDFINNNNNLAGFIPILPIPPNAQTAILTPNPIRTGATTGP